MRISENDRCVRCEHTRRMHSRLPASATSPAKAWCSANPVRWACQCEGFVMLTAYDEGDRAWTARKKGINA